MMRKLQIVVKSAKLPTYWYAGLEGVKFTVYDDRRDYILAEDYDLGNDAVWRHFLKEDCEEVQPAAVEEK